MYYTCDLYLFRKILTRILLETMDAPKSNHMKLEMEKVYRKGVHD